MTMRKAALYACSFSAARFGLCSDYRCCFRDHRGPSARRFGRADHGHEPANRRCCISEYGQQGFYSFPALAVGDYTLNVRITGFKDFSEQNIHIDANSSVRMTFNS